MAKSKKIDFSKEDKGFTLADIMGVSISYDKEVPSKKASSGKVESSAENAEWDASSPIRLSVRRKGYSGKTVTVVAGLSRIPSNLVKSIKKSLGCGASISKDGVVVQGDQRERLITFFKAKGAKNVK